MPSKYNVPLLYGKHSSNFFSRSLNVAKACNTWLICTGDVKHAVSFYIPAVNAVRITELRCVSKTCNMTYFVVGTKSSGILKDRGGETGKYRNDKISSCCLTEMAQALCSCTDLIRQDPAECFFPFSLLKYSRITEAVEGGGGRRTEMANCSYFTIPGCIQLIQPKVPK